jgi:hypothetical protein
MHTRNGSAQVVLLQHGCPSPPQASHFAPICEPGQSVFGAVHPPHPGPCVEHDPVCDSAQHGWPTPPHAPQLPLVHIPRELPQAEPEAMHTSSTQQPPPPHETPRQHFCPGAPQLPAS